MTAQPGVYLLEVDFVKVTLLLEVVRGAVVSRDGADDITTSVGEIVDDELGPASGEEVGDITRGPSSYGVVVGVTIHIPVFGVIKQLVPAVGVRPFGSVEGESGLNRGDDEAVWGCGLI